MLIDYLPSPSEIQDYWTTILNNLVEIIKSNDKYSNNAISIISRKSVLIAHFGLVEIIIPILEEVAATKKYDWDEGLIPIKRILSNHYLNESQIEKLNLLKNQLTKNEFSHKFINFWANYDYKKDSREEMIKAIESLAEEFVSNNYSWDQYIPIFYSNSLMYSFYFGKKIYSLLDNNGVNIFIEKSLSIIQDMDESKTDITVFGGFLSSLNTTDKDNLYYKIQNLSIKYILYYLISIDKSGHKHLETLFKFVEDGTFSVYRFLTFNRNELLESLSDKQLIDFCERLFKYDKGGCEVIFKTLNYLTYNNADKEILLLPIFKRCIIILGADKNWDSSIDNILWNKIICKLLEGNDSDFILFVFDSIINSLNIDNYLFNDNNDIIGVLIKNNFKLIWPKLSSLLLAKEEEYIKYYILKNILGSSVGGIRNESGLLFLGDIDIIFDWCKVNKPLAPTRIAELTPIYEKSNWHPVAKRLIDEFGDIPEMLSSLEANMNSFSCTGSLVPLYESKKTILQQLINHKFKTVSDWAKRCISYTDADIKREKVRDAEGYRFIG